MPGIPRWCIPRVYYPPTMLPWVHYLPTMLTTGTTVSTLCYTLPDDEALGSRPGLIRDMRRREALRPPMCERECATLRRVPCSLP